MSVTDAGAGSPTTRAGLPRAPYGRRRAQRPVLSAQCGAGRSAAGMVDDQGPFGRDPSRELTRSGCDATVGTAGGDRRCGYECRAGWFTCSSISFRSDGSGIVAPPLPPCGARRRVGIVGVSLQYRQRGEVTQAVDCDGDPAIYSRVRVACHGDDRRRESFGGREAEGRDRACPHGRIVIAGERAQDCGRPRADVRGECARRLTADCGISGSDELDQRPDRGWSPDRAKCEDCLRPDGQVRAAEEAGQRWRTVRASGCRTGPGTCPGRSCRCPAWVPAC